MSFFRDPNGKASMSRLLAFILVIDSTLFAGAIGYYLVKGTAEAGVICASATVITAFVGAGAVALLKRTTIGQPPCDK